MNTIKNDGIPHELWILFSLKCYKNGVRGVNTLLVDPQVIQRSSIDVCRWQGTAGERHMVWRSQDEHPTTERTSNQSHSFQTKKPLHPRCSLHEHMLRGGRMQWSLQKHGKMKNWCTKLRHLRNRGINLLVGMCCTSTTVGVASMTADKHVSV